MGNIYYEQKKYPSAIKMCRMALDQIPSLTPHTLIPPYTPSPGTGWPSTRSPPLGGRCASRSCATPTMAILLTHYGSTHYGYTNYGRYTHSGALQDHAQHRQLLRAPRPVPGRHRQLRADHGGQRRPADGLQPAALLLCPRRQGAHAAGLHAPALGAPAYPNP
eukprot:scaffold94031_cov52-Phaeocystis_antarctica.AAC.1